jgi:AAA+ superfamily predicted ATPase
VRFTRIPAWCARFHKRVEFKLPTASERETAIKHLLVRMASDKDIDVGALVEASNHFTMSVSARAHAR